MENCKINERRLARLLAQFPMLENVRVDVIDDKAHLGRLSSKVSRSIKDSLQSLKTWPAATIRCQGPPTRPSSFFRPNRFLPDCFVAALRIACSKVKDLRFSLAATDLQSCYHSSIANALPELRRLRITMYPDNRHTFCPMERQKSCLNLEEDHAHLGYHRAHCLRLSTNEVVVVGRQTFQRAHTCVKVEACHTRG